MGLHATPGMPALCCHILQDFPSSTQLGFFCPDLLQHAFLWDLELHLAVWLGLSPDYSLS